MEGVLVGCVGGAELVELEDKGVLANVKVCLYWEGSRYEIYIGVGGIDWEVEGVFENRFIVDVKDG